MTQVFVPLDGSERAEGALPVAHRLAQALEGRLQLVYVLEDQLAYGIFRVPAEFYAEEATDYLKRLAAHYGDGDTTGIRTPHGRPAETIIRLTHDTRDALVVISTRGRGDLGRALIGSVADKVARGAGCPIVMVRDEVEVPTEDWQLRRVMVTLDGSQLAEDALGPAERLARASGAALHLLRVVPSAQASTRHFGATGTSLGPYTNPGEDARRGRRALFRARRYLAKKVETLAHDDLVVTGEVAEGKPDEQIVAAARRAGADLIVMASHGRGGLQRWVLGSVSKGVVQQAPVPVMIVPNPATVRRAQQPDQTATVRH